MSVYLRLKKTKSEQRSVKWLKTTKLSVSSHRKWRSSRLALQVSNIPQTRNAKQWATLCCLFERLVLPLVGTTQRSACPSNQFPSYGGREGGSSVLSWLQDVIRLTSLGLKKLNQHHIMKLFLLTLFQTFIFCQSQPPFSPFEFLENLFKPSHSSTSPRQAKKFRSSAPRTVKPFRPHLPISPSFSASLVCILFLLKSDLNM